MTSTGITAAAWGMVEVEYTVPATCVLVHDFLACPPVNGGIAYFDACEDRRVDGFLGDKGTVIAPAQVANAGVWTDGLGRNILRVNNAAGTDFIQITKINTDELRFRYKAGASDNTHDFAITPLDYFLLGITWNAEDDVLRYFHNGPQIGADGGLGTWLGDLNPTASVIGAGSTAPVAVWSGNIAPVSLWSEALSPDEMRYLGTP
jgi:hypothetical protein